MFQLLNKLKTRLNLQVKYYLDNPDSNKHEYNWSNEGRDLKKKT